MLLFYSMNCILRFLLSPFGLLLLLAFSRSSIRGWLGIELKRIRKKRMAKEAAGKAMGFQGVCCFFFSIFTAWMRIWKRACFYMKGVLIPHSLPRRRCRVCPGSSSNDSPLALRVAFHREVNLNLVKLYKASRSVGMKLMLMLTMMVVVMMMIMMIFW